MLLMMRMEKLGRTVLRAVAYTCSQFAQVLFLTGALGILIVFVFGSWRLFSVHRRHLLSTSACMRVLSRATGTRATFVSNIGWKVWDLCNNDHIPHVEHIQSSGFRAT